MPSPRATSHRVTEHRLLGKRQLLSPWPDAPAAGKPALPLPGLTRAQGRELALTQAVRSENLISKTEKVMGLEAVTAGLQ